MDRFKRCAPTTTLSSQDVKPTRTTDMDLHQLHEWEGQGSVRDIAEKMMAFHTDGTVIATAEVLGLDLHQLWDHFVNHTDPEVIESCADPVVLA